MPIMKKVNSSRLFMGKLNHDCDLLEEITAICRKEDIRLGRIEALGAVKRACLGFYDQQSREYQFLELNEPLEITNLVGNVSLKEGNPIVHSHITLADEAGKAYGGHLAPGTIVFACELFLESFDGPSFERNFDHETGLPLWTMSE
jgi:predicted DNA-binding protein with PD1-like motif